MSSWKPTAILDAGETYNITLAGTATHGGGSCQLSLSYDEGRSFHVIKSIIGGCPLPLSYDYTVPESVPTGNALLAWTWQNIIGNREFYMNCAQVEITGSERQIDNLDSLPDLWKANLQSVTECKTTANVETIYPNPGDQVEYGGGLDSSSQPTPGSCGLPLPDKDNRKKPTNEEGTGKEANRGKEDYHMDPKFSATILNSTNVYRTRYHVAPLVWNVTLANFANKHAKRCLFKHSAGPYGENLAVSYPSPVLAIDDWASEEHLYNHSEQKFTEAAGRFTQMAWQSTTDVGCGNIACEGKNGLSGDLLVCEYYPRGNVEGEFGENVLNVKAGVEVTATEGGVPAESIASSCN